MKTKYLYIAFAGLLMSMGSCSNDNDTAPGQTEAKEDRVAIQFGKALTTSVSTRASYDKADAKIEKIGIYGLARDIVGRNEQAVGIDWWNSEDERYGTNCILKNVPAVKNGYDIAWEHGSYYYPITQFYAYDFYAYCPYSEDAILTTANNAKAIIEIDGQTDVLWGRATNNHFDYAYSAKHIREHSWQDGVNKGQIKDAKWLPCLQLNHMLTKLVFRFTPGEFVADRDIQIVDVVVKDSHNQLMLNVADLDDDASFTNGWKNSLMEDDEVTFNDIVGMKNACVWKESDAEEDIHDEDLRNEILKNRLWVWDFDSRANFHLCEPVLADGVDPTDDSQRFLDPTKYTTHPATEVTWPQQIGGSIMLYPQNFYKVYITLREKLDYLPDDVDDALAAGEKPKYDKEGDTVWRLHYSEQPLYIYLTKDTSDGRTGEDVFTESFKPSYRYYVDFTINYPTKVTLKSVIEDWTDAEQNPVDIEL